MKYIKQWFFTQPRQTEDSMDVDQPRLFIFLFGLFCGQFKVLNFSFVLKLIIFAVADDAFSLSIDFNGNITNIDMADENDDILEAPSDFDKPATLFLTWKKDHRFNQYKGDVSSCNCCCYWTIPLTIRSYG